MTGQEKPLERKRRDWIIILSILFIGFLCVILAGQWAIHFSPTWSMNTNMGSQIDPNSDFFTKQPNEFLEPLDPSILTQPAWIDVFLTPGASLPSRTPVPTSLSTNTPPATNSPVPTTIISPTNTAITPSPTNTIIYFPPPTNTSKPPAKTNTPIPPTNTPSSSLSADLAVSKSDGVSIYTPGSPLTYTIIVSNAIGPNPVTGATVTDFFPGAMTNITWTCVPTGSASCTPNGTGTINDTVNLAVGSSVTYTVNVDVLGSATGDLINTASVIPPVGVTDTNTGNNSSTDTDTVAPIADLQITKTDGSMDYIADAWEIYTVTVSNAGPSDVTAAKVTDILSTNINFDYSTVYWACVPAPASGASCTTLLGTGDIADQLIDLPTGSSVTYFVTARIVSSPSGTLDNTATVTEPPGVTDPNSGNNSASDSDTFSGIGSTPDGNVYFLPANSTLTVPIDVVANGDPGWDLVYYELPAGSGIYLDWITVEVGDGTNWYTVFNWSDNIADTNTNMDFNILTIPVIPPAPEEMDERDIAASDLYNGSGIAIDIDAIVPPGTYPYIRFYAPTGPGDLDGHTEIDAIEILP